MGKKKDLHNLVIYEIYTRNHSQRGDFLGVIDDLERIRQLGVDIIWLMPIHPIGKVNRKGTLGSSYAIADYKAINPEYGTEEDFVRLLSRAHALGLKVMMDVVYNHTSPDSVLARNHKEWFQLDEAGNPKTSVPDWSDIVELDHSHPGLRAHLLDAIRKWTRLGVDGFRCDVASLVPLELWLKAHAAAATINPAVIWLAESVHVDWVAERRKQDLFAISDSELYQAFDITYDYDICRAWERVLSGELDVDYYLDLVHMQDGIYPDDYIKLRYVENHDMDRIMKSAPSRQQALAWTAFSAFNKGAWLIYAGQEAASPIKPSHFDKDPIPWGAYELSDFIRKLAGLKKLPAVEHGTLLWLASKPVIQAVWFDPAESLVGIFNTAAVKGEIPTSIPDGTYQDLLSGEDLIIEEGRLKAPLSAYVFTCRLTKRPPERAKLLA